MTFKFTALGSLYIKENPEFLNQALESLLNQSLKASEVIIVHDGPLTHDLYRCLEKWKQVLPIKEVIIPKNSGLGNALNIGLQACTHELVARFDTDDINLPDRFKQQITLFQNNPSLSVASTSITEFNITPGDLNFIKKAVTGHENIKRYSKLRNPMNHMSVMFKKSDVLAAGGYKDHLFMEDYNLWLRMISLGYKFENDGKTSVNARVGNGMYNRRRGLKYIKSELQLFRLKNNLKSVNLFNNYINLLTRLLLRLLPEKQLKAMYTLVRHKKNRDFPPEAEKH